MSKPNTNSKSPLNEVRQYDLADCQFSIPDAAKHLGISRSYFYELIGTKTIRTVRLGKRVLIQGAELRRFMKSLDEGERDCELFLLAVAVRDDNIDAPVLRAPVSGKGLYIDSRRTNLFPIRLPSIIELPDEYAAIGNLEVPTIVFDVALVVVGLVATASRFSLSFFRAAAPTMRFRLARVILKRFTAASSSSSTSASVSRSMLSAQANNSIFLLVSSAATSSALPPNASFSAAASLLSVSAPSWITGQMEGAAAESVAASFSSPGDPIGLLGIVPDITRSSADR